MSEERPVVLITGAAGFIGTALRVRLSESWEVVALDKVPCPPIGPHAESFRCGLGDASEFASFWKRIAAKHARLRAVIHLAAYYDFSNRPNPAYQAVNEGLRRLLEAFGRDCPKESVFIFASSMASLAPVLPGERQNEDSPRLGAWQYPKAKREAEAILESASIRQPIVELVLAGVYSDFCELVPLYQTIERLAGTSIEKYFYPGASDRGLTYVHLSETVTAFVRAMEVFPGARGVHRFLIGQANPVTYRELRDRTSLAFRGRTLPLLRVPEAVALAGAEVLNWGARVVKRRRFVQPWMIAFSEEHFAFDLTRARKELGWEPVRSLSVDLDLLLKHAKYDRNEWLRRNERRPW